MVTSLTFAFDKISQVGDTASSAMPLIGGLSAGFSIGIIKGLLQR